MWGNDRFLPFFRPDYCPHISSPYRYVDTNRVEFVKPAIFYSARSTALFCHFVCLGGFRDNSACLYTSYVHAIKTNSSTIKSPLMRFLYLIFLKFGSLSPYCGCGTVSGDKRVYAAPQAALLSWRVSNKPRLWLSFFYVLFVSKGYFCRFYSGLMNTAMSRLAYASSGLYCTLVYSTAQQAHDVYTTSAQRRCNVMTLHRRWGDVVLTPCACTENSMFL